MQRDSARPSTTLREWYTPLPAGHGLGTGKWVRCNVCKGAYSSSTFYKRHVRECLRLGEVGVDVRGDRRGQARPDHAAAGARTADCGSKSGGGPGSAPASASGEGRAVRPGALPRRGGQGAGEAAARARCGAAAGAGAGAGGGAAGLEPEEDAEDEPERVPWAASEDSADSLASDEDEEGDAGGSGARLSARVAELSVHLDQPLFVLLAGRPAPDSLGEVCRELHGFAQKHKLKPKSVRGLLQLMQTFLPTSHMPASSRVLAEVGGRAPGREREPRAR